MPSVGQDNLSQAFSELGLKKEDQKSYISGILGFIVNGAQVVEVANRPGYVYVRLRDNLSETIQAYNPSVAPVYGLPVLVSRDTVDPTRYIIIGRETSRYQNWQTVSTFLARHGNQHSFFIESGGGGDVVWVYKPQIMPLLVYPSGSSGAGSVLIGSDIQYRNGMWQVLGGTGTPDLLGAKPTDGQARMLLVGLDNDGNPWVVTGSLFAGTITGSAAVTPYLPSPASGTVLAGIRLVSGTARVVWENIYDLRNFFSG